MWEELEEESVEEGEEDALLKFKNRTTQKKPAKQISFYVSSVSPVPEEKRIMEEDSKNC